MKTCIRCGRKFPSLRSDPPDTKLCGSCRFNIPLPPPPKKAA